MAGVALAAVDASQGAAVLPWVFWSGSVEERGAANVVAATLQSAMSVTWLSVPAS